MRSRVTLSMDKVFCIPFSSIPMISRANDMTSNGPRVFDNNFVKGKLAMHADLVIRASGLSRKRRFTSLNFNVHRTVLSELCL